MSSIDKKLKKSGMHIEPDRNVLDVVCGMELDPSSVKFQVEHNKELYYFCSKNCKGHFVTDPEKYIG